MTEPRISTEQFSQAGQSMVLDGPVASDEFEGYEDTYVFGGTLTHYLPDGKQYIQYKQMNEGDKFRYQRSTNRDIKVDRKTDQASFRPDSASDRHALIQAAVTGWNLATKDPKTGAWSRMMFNSAMLGNWLNSTNPRLVEDLEKSIRKANPWVDNEDATLDDLLKEQIDLEERITQKRKEEAGNA